MRGGPKRQAVSTAARRLDMLGLRLFRAAVEERSIAKAAEREAIALSAASRRITDLEARLGTALLRRHDRGVAPTFAGEVLMTQVGALFDLLDRIGVPPRPTCSSSISRATSQS